MNWKKLFNNDYVLKFIKYYNLIMLILYTIGCYIYVFDYEIYKYIYKILVSFLGFNLSSQVFVGYLLSKLKFCKWQSVAFLFNVIINILGISLNLLSNFYKFDYDLLIMTIISTIFTTYILLYIMVLKHKYKENANKE
jgi:energy-converting hydrogenase Eha subunit E